MLFAADVVETQGSVLTNNYWSEFGIESVYKGADALVSQFVSATQEIKEFFTGKVFKKVDSHSTISYSKSGTEIAQKITQAQKQYETFIRDFVRSKSPDPVPVYESVERIRFLSFDLLEKLSAEIEKPQNNLPTEEREQFRLLAEQTSKNLEMLLTATLPEIEKMQKTIEEIRPFTDGLALGTLRQIEKIDEKIRTRAEHWRIPRMAVVDRNVLRLAVYEFLFEETPPTVVINEALEIARRFSTFEATQFINGILDAIKHDLEDAAAGKSPAKKEESKKNLSKKTRASSS